MIARDTSRSGVYAIRNTVNGKAYVGSSADVDKRWRHHLGALRRGNHINPHLQAAYRKYGESAFIFELAATCSPDDLVRNEQEHIDRMRPEYNMAPTAGSVFGLKKGPLSLEHRAKISAGNKGKGHGPEWRAHMRSIRAGMKFDAGWIANISAGRRGRGRNPCREETKVKIGNGNRGKAAWSKGKKLPDDPKYKRGGWASTHLRWHVNRGAIKLGCPLCETA